MDHNIDLAPLSRSQLKQLSDDVAKELDLRERDERSALQERPRAAVAEAGFDPADLQFGRTRRRKPRNASEPHGEKNE